MACGWIYSGLFAFLWLQQSGRIPGFSEFPPDGIRIVGQQQVILRTPLQKLFRTRIRNEARLGLNFGGHYRIAEWGCGTSCVSMALVDLATGEVFDGPFKTFYYGVPRRYQGGEEYIDYKPSSRLMIVRGCLNDSEQYGTFYYAWTTDRFRQIRFVPAGPIIE